MNHFRQCVLPCLALLATLCLPTELLHAAEHPDIEIIEPEPSREMKLLIERLPTECIVLRTKVVLLGEPDHVGIVTVVIAVSTTDGSMLLSRQSFRHAEFTLKLLPAAVDKIASYPNSEFIMVQTKGVNIIGGDDVLPVSEHSAVVQAIGKYTAAQYAQAMPALRKAVKADPAFEQPATRQAISRAFDAVKMDEAYGNVTRKGVTLHHLKDFTEAVGVTFPFALSVDAPAQRKAMGDAITLWSIRTGQARLVKPPAEALATMKQELIKEHGEDWETKALHHELTRTICQILSAGDEEVARYRAEFRKPEDPAQVDPEALYMLQEGSRTELLQDVINKILAE